MPEQAVIMGVDAALYATGVGIIRAHEDEIRIVHTDLIRTSDKDDLPRRLEQIFNSISELIRAYKPDILALEDIFYSKNLKIAMSLGQARGIIMLACAKYGIRLVEYSAREIKQAITGNGAASKEQVAYMVKSLLNIETAFKTHDISDSLAAAICAGFKMKSLAAR